MLQCGGYGGKINMTTSDEGTSDTGTGVELSRLNENLARVEELSQRLVQALAHKRRVDPSLLDAAGA